MDHGRGNRNHQIFFAIRSNNKQQKSDVIAIVDKKKSILNLCMTWYCIIILMILILLNHHHWSNETTMKIYRLFHWRSFGSWVFPIFDSDWLVDTLLKKLNKKSTSTNVRTNVFYLKKRRNWKIESNNRNDLARAD